MQFLKEVSKKEETSSDTWGLVLLSAMHFIFNYMQWNIINSSNRVAKAGLGG